MARLAIRRSRLVPQNRDYQREAIVLAVEAEDLTRKPSGVPVAAESPFAYLWKEAYTLVAAADTEIVSDALGAALIANYGRAAAALIFELQKRGDVSVLFTADGQPSPLADAIAYPNRRVRFAALRAIMTLDPASPYPGSSRVPDALAWFAGGSGERRALVAMPTLAASTNLAGMLADHELDAQATNSGREAVDLARDMADLEMILVDMDIQAPGIRQILYELRISPTTGDVPIALLAAEGRLEAAEQLAAEHQRVIAVSRPHSQEVLARIVEQLANMAGRDPVSADERAAQAADARAWLDKLAGARPFYTIRRTAHSKP
jgi:CheY-like chemotaxis protein